MPSRRSVWYLPMRSTRRSCSERGAASARAASCTAFIRLLSGPRHPSTNTRLPPRTTGTRNMKIAIICGSSRKQAQSLKVSRFIDRTLQDNALCDQTWLYALTGNPLPLWDEAIWAGDPEWQARLEPLSEQLASSDAFVVVSPEWHGQ
ncbi:MAG TPA: hypothetical protein ENK12_11590, partial [Gammaproteobacteria bacterium]|nr:hypothetical protein [Gammaproteobacteria bacterium]